MELRKGFSTFELWGPGQAFSVPSQLLHSANSYKCAMLLLIRK